MQIIFIPIYLLDGATQSFLLLFLVLLPLLIDTEPIGFLRKPTFSLYIELQYQLNFWQVYYVT